MALGTSGPIGLLRSDPCPQIHALHQLLLHAAKMRRLGQAMSEPLQLPAVPSSQEQSSSSPHAVSLGVAVAQVGL
jgi:hypothetical protein